MNFDAEIEKARIQNRLAGRKERWGDPEENRKGLIPLGLGPIDAAVWGLDGRNGDLVLWIGEEKNRKSTMVRNVITNIMTAPLPLEKPPTVIDVLEPGEQPDKIADDFLCILATRLLQDAGHRSPGHCPLCPSECREMVLSSYYVLYSRLSREQEAALDRAHEIMQSWPLMIFGPGKDEGLTRDIQRARKRWDHLISQGALKQLVIDHLQQYTDMEHTMMTDYEKQCQFLSVVSDLVATDKIILHVVSQISLNSLNRMRDGTANKLDAAGGRKGAQSANLEFTVNMIDDHKVQVKITRTRRSGSLTVVVPIEKESGAQLAEPVLKK